VILIPIEPDILLFSANFGNKKGPAGFALQGRYRSMLPACQGIILIIAIIIPMLLTAGIIKAEQIGKFNLLIMYSNTSIVGICQGWVKQFVLFLDSFGLR